MSHVALAQSPLFPAVRFQLKTTNSGFTFGEERPYADKTKHSHVSELRGKIGKPVALDIHLLPDIFNIYIFSLCQFTGSQRTLKIADLAQ